MRKIWRRTSRRGPPWRFCPRSDRTSQKEELRDYYLTFAAPADIRKIYGELKDLKREKEDLDWTVPDAMVMQEME